jgi:integrase/recombinase XerD
MKKATASIYHDTRREKEGGVYPVKLKIHYNYSDKRYALNYDLTKDEFALSYGEQDPTKKQLKELKAQGKTLKGLQHTADELLALELKARNIIRDLEPFSFEQFEKRFLRPTSSIGNVFYYYKQTIDKLREEGRVSTAVNYEYSQKSIKEYLKAKNKREDYLPFDAVTRDLLEDYERWMQGEGKDLTSVGIYLRPLRALFNQAIEAGEVTRDLYPFSKSRYQIPAGSNVKKALTREDLKKLYEYNTEDPYIIKARAFWFFSYLCNGINVRDICELRYKNIKKDTIEFIRTKTKRTTKANQAPIVAALTPLAQEVIKIYGNRKNSPETYVFPIFKHHMTPEQQLRATLNFTKYINQHIKRLAKLAGVTEDISTYYARHTFSTLSVRSGKSLDFIQKTLGHSNIKTTQLYVGSLESDEIKDNASNLMKF